MQELIHARTGDTLRPIDPLFFWQGPDHCKNAYAKEFDRKNYPSEYHPPNVPRYTSRNKPLV